MKKNCWLLFGLFFTSYSLTGQWRHLPGPDGGNVIALDKDGGQLYALVSQAGIYQSDDEGVHWKLLEGSNLSDQTVVTFQAEKGVFYGTDWYGEPYQSIDGGKNWTLLLEYPPLGYLGEKLKNVYAKGDTLFIPGEFTIYRSVNRGQDWEETSNVFGEGLTRIFEASGAFFAWGGRHIYRSSDGGRTWEKVFSIASSFATVDVVDNVIYAFYESLEKIVLSSDGFETWNVIFTDSIPLNTGSLANTSARICGKGQDIYCFYYPQNVDGCNTYLSFSNDGGINWHRSNGGKSLKINLMDVEMYDDHMVLGHTQGVSVSTDGVRTLSPSQSGMQATYINSLDQQGGKLLANAWPGVFVSDDQGNSWYDLLEDRDIACNDGFNLKATKKRLALRNAFSFIQQYSEDDGITWKDLPLYDVFNFACTENTLWLLRNDKLTLLQDADTVLTDLQPWVGQVLERLGVIPIAGGIIVKTEDGHYWRFDESGQLMQQYPPPPCQTSLQSVNINYSKYDGSNLYFFCGQNAYVFRDGATDWETIYPQDWLNGIPLYLYDVVFLEAHQGILWAGLAGKGLYFSVDNGQRFYPFQPLMTVLYPTAIQFIGQEIWLASALDGIYVADLPGLPSSGQAYPKFHFSPNPSDGHLHLESDALSPEELHLDIRDIAGRLMGSRTIPPGQIWDFEFPHLPGGIYLVSLSTPDGIDTRKWVIEH